jgi:precorrin-2/cobalt-factor-2 C20-methyltransferase
MNAETKTGCLWGVGVGPGDPELMTLKAARILGTTRLIAFFAKQGRPGNARTIAAGLLRGDAEELRLEYPFTTEISLKDPRYHLDMDAFYDGAAERIAGRLTAGEDVAVLCEGDPFFYGSYMYLHDRLAPRFPVRVIAGVTGMSGCWTAAGAPITHGDDILSVLPGTLPEEALAQKLAAADAAVVMKVGRNLPKIRRALAAAGKLERALYVERGTMAGERIERLAERDEATETPYFAIVLVPGRQGKR